MPRRNPALGLGLVVLGALLFIQNAGVSRVALRAGVDPRRADHPAGHRHLSWC